MRSPDEETKMNVLVTGASRGIGLALTQYYLRDGHQVFATCRQASSALSNSQATIIDGIELTAADAGTKIASALGETKIDLLINNAGILRNESLGAMDIASVQQQLRVNSVAPLALIHALLAHLQAGTKIALITSRMGSIADNGSGGYYGYRMSKAALNAAGQSLAIDLKPQDIYVAILHPGFVQTDMVGGAGDISAEVAAERLAARIAELDGSNTGSFWHSNGQLLPW